MGFYKTLKEENIIFKHFSFTLYFNQSFCGERGLLSYFEKEFIK